MTTPGKIEVTTTGATDLGTAANSKYMLLPTPVAANTDVLEWKCDSVAAGTTIPAKYLPSLCR
jgi:type IV pilus assembly protein PilA